MNCQFSFGPNRSYFCSAGSMYAWSNNIPAALARILGDPTHPQAVDTPRDLGFAMEPGLYALCWKSKRGHDWWEDSCLGPSYTRLARFIKSAASHGVHTTRTVFGPSSSFFSASPSGYSWQNIPAALEEDIHHSMKVRRPTTVALGVGGAYVVLYHDGTITFDLRGQYPLVEAMIRDVDAAAKKRGVMYLALNPFVAGEYYAVYGNGSAAWNIPTAWSADVTTVSRQIRPAALVGEEAEPMSPASPGGAMPGGTSPAHLDISSAVGSTSGGTNTRPSSLSVVAGGTTSGGGGLMSSIVHSVETAVTEFNPAPPPPTYAYTPPPVPAQPASPPATPAEPKHKMTLAEGIQFGIKAVQGINTLVTTIEKFEGDGNQNQNQNQNQDQQGYQDQFQQQNGFYAAY